MSGYNAYMSNIDIMERADRELVDITWKACNY